MAELEQTLDSREVAEMVEKEHSKLLKDIRRYIGQFGEAKIGFTEFFRESTYRTGQNKELPCYCITKKGCEFIAHKLTGVKGTIFTARYINRFHEMENIINRQQEPELPWFIRDFGKNGKIMLFRDFKTITGIELSGIYTAWERPNRLVGGLDYNGWAWYTTVNKEEFKKEYGFDYGDDKCMMYLYFRGIRKAIRAVENDFKDGKKLSADAKQMILDGVRGIDGKREPLVSKPNEIKTGKRKPIQICITINEDGMVQQV